jgi:flagellin
LISLIQTAEGALNETHDILQRMRELAVQASNDTNTATDRSELQKEVNELIDEIDRIAKNTQFNEQNLLDGSFTGKKFHIGSNTGQDITLNINAMGSGAAATSLTAAQDTVAGVDSQDVLKNGDEVVAVKIGNDYYAPDQVEEDSGNPGNLKAKADAEKLSVTVGKSIGGQGIYTEGQDTVAGVDSQDVLKNGDEVVAVKIGNDYYAPDQVEEDSGNPGNLKAKADAEKLEIANVYQMGGTSSGGGLGVGTLKVDNVTKESQGGIMTQEGASNAITTIQNAIELVSAERSKLGAYQNRLDHTINNLSTSSENLTAAESRIRDVDYALAA